MKKSKKLLSLLLTLIMIVGLLPVVASAADGVKTEGLVTSKTATLNNDGTYTIDIEAYATGKTTTTVTENAVPLDIVLVLDQSGSMKGNNITALKKAVTTFVNQIQSNANKYNVDHRIAVVGYASSDTVLNNGKPFENTELLSTPNEVQYKNIKASDYANALVSANVDGVVNSRLTTAINRVDASGGTCTAYGMEMAKGIFDNTPTDGHTRIVVLFTDGNTDSDENDVIDYAVKLRRDSGATIFTVGFGSGLDTDFLTAVSSDMDLNYNIVYSGDLNTSKTYYYYRSPKNMGIGGESAGILSVKYINGHIASGGLSKAWRHGEWYNPVTAKTGTSDTNSNHIYFYDRISSTLINKYMLSANSADSLNNVFTTISTESTSSSTSVTLDSSAVLKDVIPASFDCSNAKYTAKSVKVKTMNGDTPTAWGTETVLKSNAAVSNNTVSVDGFDYAANYVASLNKDNAAKLVVTITGIRPTDAAVTNEKIFTNEATSGIYFNNEMVQDLQQPTTILTSKNYVVDYAKSFDMDSADWKMTNGTVYGSFTLGEVSVKNGALNGMTYTPNTMSWDGADTFYVFGQSNDSAVKSATANENGNLWSKVNVIPANNVYYEDDFVTIDYKGTWTTDGNSTDQKEVANSIHGGKDNSTLADDKTYSDGSAHKAVASKSNLPTASFTFTGKGVDVYSRTNGETGTVMAVLSGNGVNKVMTVDNLLKQGKDFYQVPTISFNDLPFGDYTVTIYVSTAAGSRVTYYLDGVRVYNPMEDTTLYDVSERNAQFVEVRDMLLKADDFGVKDGIVFTDNGNTDKVATYEAYGPENEVYLAKGQAIMFQVTSAGNGTDYYIGMSAPEGSTTVKMTNGDSASEVSVDHASDLYYKVTPDAEGNVRIENASDSILAISKLRVAGEVPVRMFAMAKAPLMSYASSFSALDVIPYEEEAVDPVVDSTDPIVVPDVDPEPAPDPEPTPDPAPTLAVSIVKTLFKAIKSLFSWR